MCVAFKTGALKPLDQPQGTTGRPHKGNYRQLGEDDGDVATCEEEVAAAATMMSGGWRSDGDQHVTAHPSSRATLDRTPSSQTTTKPALRGSVQSWPQKWPRTATGGLEKSGTFGHNLRRRALNSRSARCSRSAGLLSSSSVRAPGESSRDEDHWPRLLLERPRGGF
jgi:hypothetical protein